MDSPCTWSPKNSEDILMTISTDECSAEAKGHIDYKTLVHFCLIGLRNVLVGKNPPCLGQILIFWMLA